MNSRDDDIRWLAHTLWSWWFGSAIILLILVAAR